jgi:hypothetical protein
MSAETHVLPTYIGRSPRRPDDLGKRWVAWCSACMWEQRFQWKGGHKFAVMAAEGHACDDDPPLFCGGCGGRIDLEPVVLVAGAPSSDALPVEWQGAVLVMHVEGLVEVVHDWPRCVAIARMD